MPVHHVLSCTRKLFVGLAVALVVLTAVEGRLRLLWGPPCPSLFPVLEPLLGVPFEG